ncbi:MAG: hypothetical protein OXF21_06960 [bacterium]|nr:hypothetical protein [bacterium]
MRVQTRQSLYGSITSVGFVSGHRFVIGHWLHSPIGPFADIMWAKPDGSRVLVCEPKAAEYVTSVYPFSEVQHKQVDIQTTDYQAADLQTERSSRPKYPQNRRKFRARVLQVTAGSLSLEVKLNRYFIWFPPRPRWVTQTLENRLSQVLLGVKTYGTSPTGVSEWYRSKVLRCVFVASASIDGGD